MNKSRLEAFSDGVFAIVLTIMVLELHAPAAATPEALLALAPAMLSYALSFLYVGIYWTNHHHLFQLADRVDLRVLWANLHLLFWLSLLPFATAWIAGHHRDMAPVALYGLILLMCSISFLVLKLCLRASESAHPEAARILGQGRKNSSSILLYAVAILLAQWAPLAASVIYAALAVLWLLPTRPGTTARH
ncbi:MAG TPA: TMEM175 family protein [Herbaspirillum sp.]|uniref:TMEM175 family protein n=1 Tax=Herbaspirillum sp. TaxID=1890675 RepID=UPI002D63AA16|nr:TMEM175 family protein [Herbaspirillum sp.]HZG18940.1 TMEM175 family protein [Herbaspirillum sp.]